jgi:hypothetical protein
MAQRKQFLLRIDPELWRDVEKWAADELRSVNAQIEYVLRDAVRRRTGRARDEADAPADAADALPDAADARPDEAGGPAGED